MLYQLIQKLLPFGLPNRLKLYRTLSSKRSQKVHVDSKGREIQMDEKF